MKALTLHQPWATLVALGVKTIETRSWATSYRGPIAIHAGARWPTVREIPERTGRYPRLAPTDWRLIPTITDPAHQRPHRTDIRDRVPRSAQTPTLWFPSAGPYARHWDKRLGTSATAQGAAVYCYLGAVLATATLVDCLPIIGVDDPVEKPWAHHVAETKAGELWCWLGENDYAAIPQWKVRDVTAQEPYGDFTPGRFAWLLEDVRCLPEPVPARGYQGLWEWDTDA